MANIIFEFKPKNARMDQAMIHSKYKVGQIDSGSTNAVEGVKRCLKTGSKPSFFKCHFTSIEAPYEPIMYPGSVIIRGNIYVFISVSYPNITLRA